jgi:hypothetical protein
MASRPTAPESTHLPLQPYGIWLSIAAALLICLGGCEYGGAQFEAVAQPDITHSALAPLVERCNGWDDDGDGEVDEGPAVGCVAVAGDRDEDGDGFGESVCVCKPTGSGIGSAPDCDDRNPARYPGAPEQCNLVDDNCDWLVDNLSVNPDHSDGANCGSCGVTCDTESESCQDGQCVARCGDGACDDDETTASCCIDCGCKVATNSCIDGECKCAPSCAGLQCGDDDCGGSCGECDFGSTCAQGACVPCGVCQNFGQDWCDGANSVRCDQDDNGCGIHNTTSCPNGCSNGGCLTGGGAPSGCVNDTSDCPVNQKVRCDGPCAYRCTYDRGWQHWQLIGSCAAHGANCLCVAIGPTDTVSACGIGGDESAICGFP